MVGEPQRDIGDLAAIKEIFDRLEGRPSQKIVGPDNSPVKIQFNTDEASRAELEKTEQEIVNRATAAQTIPGLGAELAVLCSGRVRKRGDE